SLERPRATTPNQARMSRGPARITTASTSAAFANASAMARPISSVGRPSAGTRIKPGTTARSWNSSTPMISLPCALSSSSRSTSRRETTAVEDIAAAPPRTMPACQLAPNATQMPTPNAIVRPNCAAPSPNTTRRITTRSRRLTSSPNEHPRNTELIQRCLKAHGRVIVSGIGKSGHIARKVASTLSSTGTPAYFVHPAEASHGDLGMIREPDVLIAISNSGESEELMQIVPFVKREGAKLIAITGNAQSVLARAADVVLDSAVDKEACPLKLSPTASTPAPL